MLYILGGAPRCGKSIVSRRFVLEKNIPYFSTDFLIEALEKGAPQLDIKFGPFIPKAEKVWPILDYLIRGIVDWADNYLIEGDSLLPKYTSGFQDKYKERTNCCFVGFTKIKPEEKLNEVRKYSSQKDDWTTKRSDQSMLKAINSMIVFSKYLESECSKYHIKYFDVSENFQENLNKIFNYLTK